MAELLAVTLVPYDEPSTQARVWQKMAKGVDVTGVRTRGERSNEWFEKRWVLVKNA